MIAAVPHAHGLAPFCKRQGHACWLSCSWISAGAPSAGSRLGRTRLALARTLALVLAGGGVALIVGAPLGLLFGAGPIRRRPRP